MQRQESGYFPALSCFHVVWQSLSVIGCPTRRSIALKRYLQESRSLEMGDSDLCSYPAPDSATRSTSANT